MNDYLWDKTGEPDEEVERLEELLGTLRHRHRPLALPAAPPAPRRTSLPFRAPYAAAAALALAALAGLWFGLPHRRDAATNTPATLAADTTPTGRASQTGHTNRTEPAAPRVEAPTVTHDLPPPADRALSAANERGRQSTKVAGHRAAARHHARASRTAERNFAARRNPAPRRDDAPAASREEQHLAVVPTSEQQAAKEQLMFALRLTSAKLGDVKRKASATPAVARPAPDEQNKLR